MPESSARTVLRRRLSRAAEKDPRIVGLVDYGSSIAGRLDEWSDVDVAVFIRDADYDGFCRDWRGWASQFGTVLLAYVSFVGHPWLVYAAEPVPLRVDLDLYRESQAGEVCRWNLSPVSVETMVWYDGTGGRLGGCAHDLVGRSLAPLDPHAAFDQSCGDLWYHLLYTYCKLERGEQWVARQAFHSRAMEPLFRLLRLEAGAFERWLDHPAAMDAERALSPRRQAQLETCVPLAGPRGLRQAISAAARLGYEVCESIADQRGWLWPQRMADRIVSLVPEDDAL